MNNYIILNKENIEKLRSRNNGFNFKVQKYLLQYSEIGKNNGWIKKIIKEEIIAIRSEFEKMIKIKDDHLINKRLLQIRKQKKPNKLTFYQKCKMLETESGRKKLKKLGYKFTLLK